MSKISQEILEKVAYELLGSCQSEEEVLNHYDFTSNDLEVEDWLIIENITFNCNQCG